MTTAKRVVAIKAQQAFGGICDRMSESDSEETIKMQVIYSTPTEERSKKIHS